MSKIPTKEELQRLQDVSAAYDFVQKYYPGFWDRATDEDIVMLLTIGHTLYKSDPQILEATNQNLRQTPVQ